ncbi:mediator of RNA polymerase II transcription subunit 22 [Strongylocentrotus purpuratus]|uniref:Mediator of RNA polymerase II transcription subunit 22 n=1 Tax=Strongylocentrotus purpuratus TaxID=7668 RepID=A0A7M7HCK9_STRPU|nr:mediator of RNA polymerase II transcription subunit 22 [Strongylocentrotus purpuratus]XP_030853965.1 mediator of RNA polymerase II transcription subunit 22 [Strongylocentrotus purpuratus]XP_788097.1 mediator of RNA polymerase II transcription subunit 22 [Strongylocentrotus purpuratus]|eukprot:XP_011663190.1 PREDICTED: mediator of RNA polymerase II transcription subunit 22 [Strongylocentrotus purpuratus]
MSLGQAGQQQRALTQSKDTQLKSYKRRLKEDVSSILDNFTEVLKLAKVEDETQVARQAQGEQDQTEMQVRAGNIVRAGESLISLVADIKQFLILNDFPLANENIEKRARFLGNVQNNVDSKIVQLRDELSNDLYEIEEEYYSSRYK